MPAGDALRFRPMLDFIARHEGTAGQLGGGYNTSLGYGAFTGGEKNLSGMSLDQIDALQTQMLQHPKNKFNSSALGRYQIVRKTLRGLRARLGLSGSALFSPTLQDRLGAVLIRGRGRNVNGLRMEWASLKGVNAAEILRAHDAVGGSTSLALSRHMMAAETGGEETSFEEFVEPPRSWASLTTHNGDLPTRPSEENLETVEFDGELVPALSTSGQPPSDTTYRVERIPFGETDIIEDHLNKFPAEGWEVKQIIHDKKDLVVILKGNEGELVEIDDSPDPNMINFAALGASTGGNKIDLQASLLLSAPGDGYVDQFKNFFDSQGINNFRAEEFLTLGGQHYSGPCKGKNSYPPEDLWKNIIPTARILDTLRDKLKAPINLTSVYRSAAYNACIPGTAGGSVHRQFKAADFKCADGNGPVYWAKTLKRMRDQGLFLGGIGVYQTFVHIDTRGYNANFGPLKHLVF